jgi:hypothetical protein
MGSDLVTRFVAALDAAHSTEAARSAVDVFAGAEGMAACEFLDEVALSVGEGFISGEVSFDETMGIMATIYGALFPSDLLIANEGESLTYHLYWALDEGAYPVERDGDTDPVEARALPAVRKLLAEAARSSWARPSNHA